MEETPVVDGARIKIAARSEKEAGGIVRRSYLASKLFNVELSEDVEARHIAEGATPVHHATKKSPSQLQREINETLAASKLPARRTQPIYECGRSDCPGTVGESHRDEQCPGKALAPRSERDSWIVRFGQSVRRFGTEHHAEQFARALRLNGTPYTMARET